MKVLKVELHQQTAVYRNPVTAEVIETYPLPPPSTVLGMLYSLTGELEPEQDSVNLSIQGRYGAIFRDYQWYKKYDLKSGKTNPRPYPILVHTLFDVELTIHIFSPNERFMEEVKKRLLVPPYFPYLGRAEDLVKIAINGVREVECKLIKVEAIYLHKSAYILEDQCKVLGLSRGQGVRYQLPTFHKFIPVIVGRSTKMLREFQWIPLIYAESEAYLEKESKVWKDEEDDYIWWCMPSPPLLNH